MAWVHVGQVSDFPAGGGAAVKCGDVQIAVYNFAAQGRWYDVMLDAFGPERCMFESNFPVDKFCVDYAVVWGAFEQFASRFTDAEQDQLFAGTARRVYRL